MRINDLSSLSLIEYHYLHKSHLFVPLSVYDVMTALLFACFLLSIYFISDLGNRFALGLSLWIWRKYQMWG